MVKILKKLFLSSKNRKIDDGKTLSINWQHLDDRIYSAIFGNYNYTSRHENFTKDMSIWAWKVIPP